MHVYVLNTFFVPYLPFIVVYRRSRRALSFFLLRWISARLYCDLYETGTVYGRRRL
jgi:hypothetical protein